MNSHLQSIIEKCRKLRPIKKITIPQVGTLVHDEELWEGCIIKFEMRNMELWACVYFYSCGLSWCPFSNDDWQELEPITLQDILLAMGEEWGIDGKWNFIRTILEKSEWFKMTWTDCHNIWYNLNLSPYDQEESVLEFISKNI